MTIIKKEVGRLQYVVSNTHRPALHDFELEWEVAGQRPQRGWNPVKHRGIFVYSSICSFVLWWPESSLWTDSRPEEASWTNSKPERTEISPDKADLRLGRLKRDLRSLRGLVWGLIQLIGGLRWLIWSPKVQNGGLKGLIWGLMADLRPESLDLRPENAYLWPERADWR